MHCHSISGFAYFLGISAITWSHKKQPIVTLLSTEAEYVALTHASKDIYGFINYLLNFLPFLVLLYLPLSSATTKA